MNATQTELRLARLVGERETTQKLHEDLLADVEKREDKALTETEQVQIRGYRERAVSLDEEIKELSEALARHNATIEESRKIRSVLSGNTQGIDTEGDGVVYRTMAAYARDVILTREGQTSQAIGQMVDRQEVERAAQRLQLLKRAPEHTLSSDVAGLQPAQHIAQIFQVIDSSRPIVASANRVPLDRGNLTYPALTGRPAAALQSGEKTVGDTADLNVTMETATASTYNAGGNLSWQAINWTTPSALDLWFQVAAASYALLTETDAGDVLTASAEAFDIADQLDGTDDYDAWMAAITQGAGEVYANSGRMANTLYVAPDQFYAFAGLVPVTQAAAFLDGGVSLTGQSGSFAGLRLVPSRGLGAGVVIIGDSSALLVAESPGAPVELRAVEAQIGGLQVGIIGAFEAVVADEGAFASLSVAS